jgi:transcriptional regulator with XRE-family HTH domain
MAIRSRQHGEAWVSADLCLLASSCNHTSPGDSVNRTAALVQIDSTARESESTLLYTRVTVYPTPLHERLAAVVGQRSSRYIGELTGTNHETVRRYISGYAPSVEFLQSLCKAFGVSGEWLLTGKGPMKAADIRGSALREADAGELLSALASSVETLISRVDRLELFLQSMETRLRAIGPASAPAATSPVFPPSSQESHDGQAGLRASHATVGQAEGPAGARTAPQPAAPTPASPEPQTAAVAIPQRVLKLRNAFPKRPHEDAR